MATRWDVVQDDKIKRINARIEQLRERRMILGDCGERRNITKSMAEWRVKRTERYIDYIEEQRQLKLRAEATGDIDVPHQVSREQLRWE